MSALVAQTLQFIGRSAARRRALSTASRPSVFERAFGAVLHKAAASTGPILDNGSSASADSSSASSSLPPPPRELPLEYDRAAFKAFW
jgi:hypothetical protein